jgi:Glycosyl transferase family group 2
MVVYQRPAICPMFGRLLGLSVLLFISCVSAATWYGGGRITWLFDYGTGTFPILHCPEFILNPGNVPIDGPRCVVRVNYSNANYMAIVYKGNSQYCEVDTASKIDCRMESTCEEAILEISEDGLLCEANFPEEPVQFLCSEVKPVPFCDSEFAFTPGNMVAIRGLFSGTVVVILIWLLAELVLWSVDSALSKEQAIGKERQASQLPGIMRSLRLKLEAKWEAEKLAMFGRLHIPDGSDTDEFCSTISGPTPFGPPDPSPSEYWQATSCNRTAINSRDPKRRFHCSGWKRKISNWRQLRIEKSQYYQPQQLGRTAFLVIFFQVLLTTSMFLIILGSPRNLVNRGNSIFGVIYGSVSIWNIHSWLDLLIFTDVVLDFGLFIMACLAVSWPTEPVFASHLKSRLEKLGNVTACDPRDPRDPFDPSPSPSPSRQDSSETGMTESSSGGSLLSILNHTLTQDVCLLIACHQSTLTEGKEKTFRNTLLSALRVFPPNHIFICDNGNSLSPVDGTWKVVKDIHEEINYVYIPEGNKTFAFYWTNHYWIPYLEKSGKICNHFRYAILIDDDVPLPGNLHIPIEHLRSNPDIKAVHFAVTAASENPSGPNLLVQNQDIEYKLSGVHKYFQSSLSRALSCHGAIALWERETLDNILFEHDTVFHGEDLYMGLSLLRKRDKSKIISCPQTIVPTYCPDTWAVLLRQRVKSWELTSHKKTFTYLVELVTPESFLHSASLVLKPYFLQEFLAIILDWLRIYLLLGLLFRDWLALSIMTGSFIGILYLQVALFQFVYLRRRSDLRASLGGAMTFPLYKLSSLIFRVCALCQNILVYSHLRKSVNIKTREDEIKDIPPVPPHSDPDWFTVWCGGGEDGK